ncbi:MAG: carboxypeptidase-like regulatory domain-containing protein [Mangrovibacterium sp.]
MKTVIVFIFSLLIFPFLISSTGQGPSRHVWGKVVDQTTENPLYGVNVCIPELMSQLGTITNKNGEFRLWNIPDSVTSLTVSLNGYEPIRVNISQFPDSTESGLLIRLHPVSNSKPSLPHLKKRKY